MSDRDVYSEIRVYNCMYIDSRIGSKNRQSQPTKSIEMGAKAPAFFVIIARHSLLRIIKVRHYFNISEFQFNPALFILWCSLLFSATSLVDIRRSLFYCVYFVLHLKSCCCIPGGSSANTGHGQRWLDFGAYLFEYSSLGRV